MGWQRFIDDYQIPFRKGSGKNLEIHCPLCGSEDKSKHMGVRTDSVTWGCFRRQKEHGSRKSPVRLIAALLNCEWAVARTIARNYFEWDFQFDQKTYPDGPREDVIQFRKPLKSFLKFEQYADDRIATYQQEILNYLVSRELDPSYVVPRFDLRWGYNREYFRRLIIPVMKDPENWITWTSRAVAENDLIRYRAAKVPDETKHPVGDFLFDYQNLNGGRDLYICEGSFDAMKITQAMIPDVSATALFKMDISDRQLLYLSQLSEIYENLYLCYDGDVFHKSLEAATKIHFYVPNLTALYLPFKDFGGESLDSIRRFITLNQATRSD